MNYPKNNLHLPIFFKLAIEMRIVLYEESLILSIVFIKVLRIYSLLSFSCRRVFAEIYNFIIFHTYGYWFIRYYSIMIELGKQIISGKLNSL